MIEHITVQVRDAALHVAKTGKGPPLLLLHGWPEFWLTWEPMMTRLADRFELFAPDLRGFGSSDKPTGFFGPDEQADDIAALIEALGIAPVGVVSHDVGASVAQSLARRRPHLLRGLFFFNFLYPGIGARYNEPAQLREVWHTWFNQSDIAEALVGATPEATRIFITHFLKRWAHQPNAFDDEALDAFVANFREPGNIEGGFRYYRSATEQRIREAAQGIAPSAIALPTCVRWGDSDPALPLEFADRLGEFFTDLDFAPVAGVGHFAHRETPDEAAGEVARFFRHLEHR